MNEEMILTQEQEAAKAKFIAKRGIWKWKTSSMWDDILAIDPNIISGYASYSAVPFANNVISAKDMEMFAIAIDASITHMHVPGMKNHIRHAIELGATKGEILETLVIASTIGSHTFIEGYKELATQLKAAGTYPTGTLSAEQEATKAKLVVNEIDYWEEDYEYALRLDPVGFDAFVEYLLAPLKGLYLSPKMKEFVWLAVDGSPTTIYKPGIERHIRRALELGATVDELSVVLETVSCLGVHSVTVGIPILKEALADETLTKGK